MGRVVSASVIVSFREFHEFRLQLVFAFAFLSGNSMENIRRNFSRSGRERIQINYTVYY